MTQLCYHSTSIFAFRVSLFRHRQTSCPSWSREPHCKSSAFFLAIYLLSRSWQVLVSVPLRVFHLTFTSCRFLWMKWVYFHALIGNFWHSQFGQPNVGMNWSSSLSVMSFRLILFRARGSLFWISVFFYFLIPCRFHRLHVINKKNIIVRHILHSSWNGKSIL